MSEIVANLPNILIVESNDDKAFLEAIVRHLNEVSNLSITISEYYCLDGIEKENYSSLEQRLRRLERVVEASNIQKIGIVVDLDRETRHERLAVINQCIHRVFQNSDDLEDTRQLFNLNLPTETRIGCHFIHVNEQGELETVLRAIKTKDSPHADCIEAWRACLEQRDIAIDRQKMDKKVGKLWVHNYVREDTPSEQEKRKAGDFCKLSHALTKTDIWDFEHPVLDELKEFLRLFA